MIQFEKFRLIEPYQGYDYINNPDKYNVLELVPKKIEWFFDNVYYSIENDYGVLGQVFDNNSKALVICGIYGDINNNNAYVINGKKEMLVNISDMFEGHIVNSFYLQGNNIYLFAYNINERCDYVIELNNKLELVSKNIFK